MKKSLLFLFFLVPLCQLNAWQLYGPGNVIATNICFAELPNSGEMICTNDGMFLFNENNYQWDYYSEAGLPVIEGIFLETETILLVMGNGSYSDGIYSFNVITGQFSVLQYCLEPTFLRYDQTASKYYVGHSAGLLISEDVINWEESSFFSGKNCLEMSMDYLNLVVSVNEFPPNVYWSDNSGDTWNNASTFTPIFRMASYYSSHFFGMCPLNTAISGFYSSEDGGNSWDPEFLSNNISDISYDQNGFLLVSWNNPGSEYEGIAIYEQGSGISGLTFLNEGLPSTSINRVKQREGIDVHFAYVCTDMGVYTYVFVGMEEKKEKPRISVNPNPFSDHLALHFENSFSKEMMIELIDLSGSILFSQRFIKSYEDDNTLELDFRDQEIKMEDGIYLLKIALGNSFCVKKVVCQGLN